MSDVPRIHIEFATAAPIAVILRRGPSSWVRLLRWNTVDDTVEPGAWFHGRIHADRCGISPNGELFAYLAAKYSGATSPEVGDAWVAICKPPWLTALALWPDLGSQEVGAAFIDDRTLLLSLPHWESSEPLNPMPAGFTVIPHWTGKGAPVQSIPQTAKSSGYLRDGTGVDQYGRAFAYTDGKLLRDDVELVNLADMQPDPQPPPQWARSW